MAEQENIQRDIGRMEAEIVSLKETMEDVRKDLKDIKQSFHELKGGTKFMMSAAAVAGAIISFAFSWLSLKH